MTQEDVVSYQQKMMEANLRSLERGNQVADEQQQYFKAMKSTRTLNEKQPVQKKKKLIIRKKKKRKKEVKNGKKEIKI